MSSAYANTTTLAIPSVEKANKGHTTWLIEEEVKQESELSNEVIVIDRVIFKSRVQSYADKHSKLNLAGLVITALSMIILALASKAWIIFFVVPFFLGFLEMYITVLVDKHSRSS
ncbi:MAG TPA: hypothetical protein VGF75_03265 [Candidatus Saccharimonadales bacterium]|jgi:hypothetical protein